MEFLKPWMAFLKLVFGIFEASLLLTSTKKYTKVIMIYYLLSANNLLILMEFLKLLFLEGGGIILEGIKYFNFQNNNNVIVFFVFLRILLKELLYDIVHTVGLRPTRSAESARTQYGTLFASHVNK